MLVIDLDMWSPTLENAESQHIMTFFFDSVSIQLVSWFKCSLLIPFWRRIRRRIQLKISCQHRTLCVQYLRPYIMCHKPYRLYSAIHLSAEFTLCELWTRNDHEWSKTMIAYLTMIVRRSCRVLSFVALIKKWIISYCFIVDIGINFNSINANQFQSLSQWTGRLLRPIARFRSVVTLCERSSYTSSVHVTLFLNSCQYKEIIVIHWGWHYLAEWTTYDTAQTTAHMRLFKLDNARS